jgi:hypothetical protein
MSASENFVSLAKTKKNMKILLLICFFHISFYAISQYVNPQEIDSLGRSKTDISKMNWQMPEKGNYLMLMNYNTAKGSIIFQQSRMVYYDYDFNQKSTETSYKTDKKRIHELFDFAGKINFEDLSGKVASMKDTSDIMNFQSLFMEATRNPKK